MFLEVQLKEQCIQYRGKHLTSQNISEMHDVKQKKKYCAEL